MKKLSFFSLLVFLSLFFPAITFGQGFNVASTYEIADPNATSGDIIITNGTAGLTRTNVAYDARVFGVIEDNPLLVLRPKEGEGTPIIRAGDTIVNVSNYNDDIKKGDLITSSPVAGKGMKAKQSGYVLGVALEDAQYGDQTSLVEGKAVKVGTAKIALRIEYGELTTARNSIHLFNELNSALFRNVSDPERFVSIIRYIIAGLIAIIAFSIGFFWVSRSISKAVEAVGRNPLAKQSIYTSVILQIGLTVVGGIVTIGIIFVLITF